MLTAVVIAAGVMASILFCEMDESFSSVGDMIGWTFKLAILGDGGGLLMSSFSKGSGLELLTAEVRRVWLI